MSAMQFNMFGPPEPVESYPEGRRFADDAPVPSERELLWPADLAELLGTDLLERLYGDIPRRTLLTRGEVCRRGRIQHTQFHTLIHEGSLDAVDMSAQSSSQPYYRVYRYSLVRLRFAREFVSAQTRCNIPTADLDACIRAADQIRKRRRSAA